LCEVKVVPVYEYECSVCHFCFERKQSFDAETVATCPKCQEKASRVIHSIPIIFKGSGFYVTDSRKKTEPEKSEGKLSGKEKAKGK